MTRDTSLLKTEGLLRVKSINRSVSSDIWGLVVRVFDL
jgi:hypothetical protein